LKNCFGVMSRNNTGKIADITVGLACKAQTNFIKFVILRAANDNANIINQTIRIQLQLL